MYSIENIRKFIDDHPEFFTDSRVKNEVMRRASEEAVNGAINPVSMQDIFSDFDAILIFDHEVCSDHDHRLIVSGLARKFKKKPN